jgi:hypothetical protein
MEAMRAAVVLVLGAWGCGASHSGGDSDADVDADTDTDTDADGDTDTASGSLPECPTEDLILGEPCLSQATCDAEHVANGDWRCNIAGGVCVEEQWICGDCGYCFYNRVNHLDPPSGWECDEEDVHCVPR